MPVIVRLAVLPTDAQWTGGIALGGTREGQAAAQRDAVQRVPEFLREVTGPRTPGRVLSPSGAGDAAPSTG